MKYNLGCGKRNFPGWINVDMHINEPNVVRKDLCDIAGWWDEPATEVMCIHVLEHLELDDTINFLDAIQRKMRQDSPLGSRLIVEMPCFTKCLALALEPVDVSETPPAWNEKPWSGLAGFLGDRVGRTSEWLQWMHEHRYSIIRNVQSHEFTKDIPEEWGEAAWPGDAHKFVWDTKSFAKQAHIAGFNHIAIEAPQTHGRRVHRDMRVVCECDARCSDA